MNGIECGEISFKLLAGSPRTNVTRLELPPEGPGRLPRVTQVLALAIQFEDMLTRADAKDYADLARLGGLCRERVSQIMRLIYLAPDIQIELLYLPPSSTGRFPISETSVRKIAGLLSWTDQRERWLELQAEHCLSRT
jgi:hypothetical protein